MASYCLIYGIGQYGEPYAYVNATYNPSLIGHLFENSHFGDHRPGPYFRFQCNQCGSTSQWVCHCTVHAPNVQSSIGPTFGCQPGMLPHHPHMGYLPVQRETVQPGIQTAAQQQQIGPYIMLTGHETCAVNFYPLQGGLVVTAGGIPQLQVSPALHPYHQRPIATAMPIFMTSRDQQIHAQPVQPQQEIPTQRFSDRPLMERFEQPMEQAFDESVEGSGDQPSEHPTQLEAAELPEPSQLVDIPTRQSNNSVIPEDELQIARLLVSLKSPTRDVQSTPCSLAQTNEDNRITSSSRAEEEHAALEVSTLSTNVEQEVMVSPQNTLMIEKPGPSGEKKKHTPGRSPKPTGLKDHWKVVRYTATGNTIRKTPNRGWREKK